MSQKNQSSSNDTNFTFGANAAPAPAINDTPGSQESGGGGTVSYRAPGSAASTNSFTVITQADSLRGSANRSTSARSPRAPRSRAMEGGCDGGRSPSGTATREDEVGKPATSSKRKSSTSATRNESEARLRRQLQHNTEKLERSERARTELENRLILYQDVLAHRDQMINNVEVYSQQHHEEYQEHVNSEMEFMRRSLINAYNILDEQSTALAEAHLMDEGSTQRILELERRGQLAEAGAAHIVQESVAMRGRYLSELENASQLIRRQQEMSEAMTNHFRQDGIQIREACAQYVNEKEIANKEEMELLRQRLTESSQMMVDNNEMIVEHGQRAVALRDERMAEMQSTIDELNASLSRKDDIIAAKDSATRDHFANVRDMKSMIQTKDDEYKWKHNELEVEIRSLMRLNENEIASREWYEKRFNEEKDEYRQFRYTELRTFKDREVSVEYVKDELMDENMKLIESNNQLRTRIAELLGSRFSNGDDETNAKVNEELRDELHKANLEINRLQEGVECNPNLTEALVNAEEAEADRWKKLYKTACSERDTLIRKNDSLKLSLHDAKWAMKSMPASWNTAAPTAAVPASASAMPPASLIPRTTTSTSQDAFLCDIDLDTYGYSQSILLSKESRTCTTTTIT